MKVIPSPMQDVDVKSDDELKRYSDEMFAKTTSLQANDKKIIDVYTQHINACFNAVNERNLALVSELFKDERFLYYCSKDIRLKHLKCLNDLVMLNPQDGMQLYTNLNTVDEYDYVYMKLYFLFRRIQLQMNCAECECLKFIDEKNIPIVFVALVLFDCAVGGKLDVLFKLADCYVAKENFADAIMLLALSSKLAAKDEEKILAKVYSIGK